MQIHARARRSLFIIWHHFTCFFFLALPNIFYAIFFGRLIFLFIYLTKKKNKEKTQEKHLKSLYEANLLCRICCRCCCCFYMLLAAKMKIYVNIFRRPVPPSVASVCPSVRPNVQPYVHQLCCGYLMLKAMEHRRSYQP